MYSVTLSSVLQKKKQILHSIYISESKQIKTYTFASVEWHDPIIIFRLRIAFTGKVEENIETCLP